ncbi:hypothetical protein [Phaeacidiphilus oryzae]|jgi:hypothetical protein|uniref:hypothetical protein n=1 Tax=Phaeacidiphilus oryzae TaxID=348818 RepID=UPI000567E7CF|nr:hypothetical protein [Phaeacidiphilus oryzae]
MGPALIGAIALSRAGSLFDSAVSADPSLGAIKQAAEGAGPVVVNSVPPAEAIGKAASHAVPALGSGYSLGFLIVAVAALACAVVTAGFLGGRQEQEEEIAMVEQRKAAV